MGMSGAFFTLLNPHYFGKKLARGSGQKFEILPSKKYFAPTLGVWRFGHVVD